ncbi:hypothetical protein ACFC1R_06240 [Kitasatospora sp. NPDC056138]|uniref:hypothetical protein n=1 Tax=Kitasatospora sp. NPDC056138 TaxID=3345724 RepID=UPI0035DD5E60
MLTQDQVRVALRATIDALPRPGADVVDVDHNRFRIVAGTAETALRTATVWTDRNRSWRVLEAEGKGGEQFTLWLTVAHPDATTA